MKKTILVLTCLITAAFSFCQTAMPKTISTGKILLSDGQKIIAASTISIDADLSNGMELHSSSTTENALEVKTSTDKNYTVTSTLTKLKVNFKMMGQATNYDSEKNEAPSSEVEKSFADRLNKPVDVILDNSTGQATLSQKKEKNEEVDNENPVDGMLKMFSESSDDGVVSGAFKLVPQGKNVGDQWADTTTEKDQKTIRTYTLKSVSGNDALIQLDIVTTANTKLDMQGMEFEIKTTTKTSGDITTDINTGLLKTKNTKSEITGSLQLMGQDVPISATVNTTNTYK